MQLGNWCNVTSPYNQSLHDTSLGSGIHQAHRDTHLGEDADLPSIKSTRYHLPSTFHSSQTHLHSSIILTTQTIIMKLYAIVLALAALAAADPGNFEARAGCSQKGQYCNGGTFLCCPGQGSCSGNVVCLLYLPPLGICGESILTFSSASERINVG